MSPAFYDTQLRVTVHVQDPWADPAQARQEYGLDLVTELATGVYDGVILAVAHKEYCAQGVTAIRRHGRKAHVFFDMKSKFSHDESDLRL